MGVIEARRDIGGEALKDIFVITKAAVNTNVLTVPLTTTNINFDIALVLLVKL